MRVKFPNSVDVLCPALFGHFYTFFSQDSKEPAIHSPSTVNKLTAILLKFRGQKKYKSH